MVKVSVKLVFLFIILLGFTLAHSGIGQEIKFSNDTLKVHQPDSLVVDDSPPPVFISPDFVPDVPYDLVGDRLSCIEKEIPLNYNSKVRAFIEYFAVRNREYTQRMINRKNLYFPIFEKYLKEYGLPDELKYLAIVESGLETAATSRVGAGGLWQFMPATGRLYGLKQDWYIDERRDPEKATEAACKYLKFLYDYFDDWELALAAYNSGPGNVRKAIRRSGYKKKFWEIYRYLKRETRSYVPQFVAVMYVLNYADEHNFNQDSLLYAWETDTITVNKYLNLETFAGLTNICLEDLARLNPELKRSAVPDYAKNYPLKIPADKYDFIDFKRSYILDSASRKGQKELEFIAKNSVGSTYGKQKIIHRVRRGDVIGKIAEKYKVRVSDVRAWNNLRGNTIRIDQRLAVWVKPSQAKKVKRPVIAKNDSPKQPAGFENGRVLYKVQPGDTLWDISRKHKNLSIDKIKKLNNLKTNKIKPGQTLVLG